MRSFFYLMNIENLRKKFNDTDGELVIKNYKYLCEILEIEPKKGNSKKAHIKEFERYFNWENQGQKFIIKEFYKMALSKEDGRGTGGKYSDDIQDLMIALMYQSVRDELFLSANVLLKKLNMINCNYATGRRNVPKLSELINVDEDVIYDFYNTTSSNLVTVLETALKRLRSRRLIMCENVIGVAKVNLEQNELGESKVDIVDNTKNKATVNTSLNYRQATPEEKHIILEIEKQVLKEMGYRDTKDVFVNGLWHSYKRKVTIRVREQLNIKYHFEAYLITFNRTYIEEEFKEIKNSICFTHKHINNTVYKSVKENAVTKHNNSSIKKSNLYDYEDVMEFYTEEELRKKGVKILRSYDKTRLKDNFLTDTIKIADTVILPTAKDLSLKLKETVKEESKGVKNKLLPF